MIKTKRTTNTTNTINPFLINKTLPTVKRNRKLVSINKISLAFNNGNPTVYKNASIHADKKVDAIEFIQIVDNDLLGILKDCNNFDIKVISFIFKYCIKFNCDYLTIDNAVCADYIGTKDRAGIYKTIKKLISNEVLAKKDGKTYWLNPFKVFKGNRKGIFDTMEREIRLNEKLNNETNATNAK